MSVSSYHSFSHEFERVEGYPGAKLEIFYPSGNGSASPVEKVNMHSSHQGGTILLHIPAEYPAETRAAVLGEQQELAKVLGGKGVINGDGTAIRIHLGKDKSLDGFSMLLIRELEAGGVISPAEGKNGIHALLMHEEHQREILQVRTIFQKAGAEHTTQHDQTNAADATPGNIPGAGKFTVREV